MKRRDLEKKLTELGFTFERNGGDHDIFASKSGIWVSVPRHRDINEITAKKILKEARRG